MHSKKRNHRIFIKRRLLRVFLNFRNAWRNHRKILAVIGSAFIVFTWIFDRKEVISSYFKNSSEIFEDENFKHEKIGYSGDYYEGKRDSFKCGRIVLQDSFLPPRIINGIYIKGLSKESFLYVNYLGRDADLAINNGQLERDILVSYCKDFQLVVRVVNDHVYAYVEFNDLQTGRKIGTMNFNKWEVLDDRNFIYKFKNEDHRLEVLDVRGKVVFSMSYNGKRGRSEIDIAGYFCRDSAVFIMPNDPKFMYRTEPSKLCIHKTDSDWFNKAKAEIAHIKPVFTY